MILDNQSIADLGETDKFQKLVQAVSKDSRQKGSLKSQKAIPISCKGSDKCNSEQMMFYLNAVGTPLENTDQQLNTMLVSLWKSLKLE